ncbi:MAG: hypothetical protein ACPL06_04155 [Candidatus Anstonellales archaeon]
METKIIVVALALVLLFGMNVVQASDWEDDWDSENDLAGGSFSADCCGSSFIILALGLALVSYKHF